MLLKGSDTWKITFASVATFIEPFEGKTIPVKFGGVLSEVGGMTTTGACSTVKLVITTLDTNLLPAMSFVMLLSTVAMQDAP
ncbi:hypothetical protein GCM10011282_19310 [Undibacterium macrobrachii]|uniref:Uncharacterized protein n=1 Tax=Undibacterium macrobrachii TaxID=1119058 RepID=A0ABQ2XEU1_9BURK|nr:hypothetical protein GCM10011282_19310 [Undibacterium macrobrachii]